MSRICFTALLAMMTTSLTVQAEEQQKPAAPAAADFPQRVDMRAEAIKLFDKDGDGKLNDAERAAMREARQAKAEQMRKNLEKEFDKNGDGKLDDAERAALADAKKNRMEQFRKAREKAFDKDGDGKLNDAERKAMQDEFQKHRPKEGPGFQDMIKRFDKDGDGKLNETERKAMMEARKQRLEGKGPRPVLPKPPAEPPATTEAK